MKKPKSNQFPAAAGKPRYKPLDPSRTTDEPPLVIREADFLDALESEDVQQALARVRRARDAGAFGQHES